MEKISTINPPIKLAMLDIYPSYEELNPSQEEMLLIFQGLNMFFDLYEILSTKKIIEIPNNNQTSIIVSLIKSNNILATGVINIKNGEQWITFSYENKNKKMSSNLALSLIDCIKLKLFCEIKTKNHINNNFSNINNNSAMNINVNSSLNFANKSTKVKTGINQINLKISKKNINNKILLKGSPMKTNNEIPIKKSPKKEMSEYNSIKVSNDQDIGINNYFKNNNFNFNSFNSHANNSNINMNPYTTISKCSIKKIDLNFSNKTRNSKIAKKKKNINGNYGSLRTFNNNYCIKKMNTSTCSLNTINKNHKKSRLTPDIEVKEIRNVKNCGGSPNPIHKKKLLDDIYDNCDKANDKAFHCVGKTKTKILKIKDKNTTNSHENIIIHNRRKNRQNNYSNNIANINNENSNNLNLNTLNEKCSNENNFNSTFNNSFNSINKQVFKSKLIYTTKHSNNKHINNNNNIYNNSIINSKKNDLDNSITIDEEEKNKTKDNNQINDKAGIYTTKRIDIKKNTYQSISKKLDSQDNTISHKIINKNNEDNKVKQIQNGKKEEKKEENKINDEIPKNEKDNIVDNNDNNIDNDNNDNNIDNEIEYDNFERVKEDFILLYNDDYVNNIQDDLLKLEIELFVEKMTELISCYHMQLEEKKLENEILQNDYNLISAKYKNIHKLIKKLEISKIDSEINKLNSKNNKKSLKKTEKTNLMLNKTEIEIFKNIFPTKESNKDKKILPKLKEILMKIIKKEENLNILSNNDKFNEWISLYFTKNKKEKNKVKTRLITPKQTLQTNGDMQADSSFNCNNIINKNNDINYLKYNSYCKFDNTYKKKLPISPIYSKNNKYIPGTEIPVNKIVKEY